MHRTAPTTKNNLAQNVSKVEIETVWPRSVNSFKIDGDTLSFLLHNTSYNTCVKRNLCLCNIWLLSGRV